MNPTNFIQKHCSYDVAEIVAVSAEKVSASYYRGFAKKRAETIMDERADRERTAADISAELKLQEDLYDLAFVYTNNLKSWLLARSRPKFEPAKGGAEAAKPTRFSDAGGLKVWAKTTKPEANSSGCLCIYLKHHFL